jgi:V8-like Glu-specific endopeptidase
MLKLTRLSFIFPLFVFGVLNSQIQANIIGSDDRVPMLSEAMPWSAIGKLSIGEDKVCTATLVARDIILTAAHCLLNTETKRSLHLEETILFSPNLKEGHALHNASITAVWMGTFDPYSQPWQDYAFAKISQPLGEIYGFLKVKSYPGVGLDHGESEIVSLPGYSIDFEDAQTAGVHLNCAIQARLIENDIIKLLSHDCDMRMGASGAPLLSFTGSEASIIGINLAQRNFLTSISDLLGIPTFYSPRTTANLAVTTDRMIGLFNILSRPIYHSNFISL